MFGAVAKADTKHLEDAYPAEPSAPLAEPTTPKCPRSPTAVPVFGPSLSMPVSRRHPLPRLGSTSQCGSSNAAQTAGGLPTDQSRQDESKVRNRRRRSNVCAGALIGQGEECQAQHRPEIRARSWRKWHRTNAADTREARLRAGCGTHCLTSTVISEARVVGSSTTPSDSVPVCASKRRSQKGPQTFSSNRRMNKSQQMRWSRRGADLLASGSLRGLQWNARLWIGPPISAACR